MLDMYRNGGRAENGLWLRETSEGTAVCGLADGFEPEELIIPEGAVRIMPRAFEGCGSIKKAVIADSVRAVGERAFAECGALKEIHLKRGLYIGETVFADCPNIHMLLYTDMSKYLDIELSPWSNYSVSFITFLDTSPTKEQVAEFEERLFARSAPLAAKFCCEIYWYDATFGCKPAAEVLRELTDKRIWAAVLMNLPENVDRLLKRGAPEVNADVLDRFINISIANGRREMYIVLIEHKKQINGYSDGDRLKL